MKAAQGILIAIKAIAINNLFLQLINPMKIEE